MSEEAEGVDYDLGPWKVVVKGSRKEFGREELGNWIRKKKNITLLEKKL